MRDPMARSRRLTDGTRWRIFMRLLRFGRLVSILHQRGHPGARGELTRVKSFYTPQRLSGSSASTRECQCHWCWGWNDLSDRLTWATAGGATALTVSFRKRSGWFGYSSPILPETITYRPSFVPVSPCSLRSPRNLIMGSPSLTTHVACGTVAWFIVGLDSTYPWCLVHQKQPVITMIEFSPGRATEG